MSDIAIRVEHLGKAYQISHEQGRSRYRTLQEEIIGAIKRPFSRSADKRETFWALKDVSFEVKVGEALGIIGRNGAGKSTLLKILSRITRPTTGYADVYGRVGSLLEVGTGFHPELTGRENIYLNGAILGMTRRDIQRRFDEIVAFAEVENFLDTPVKRYSSGMYMRLAFAVAAHLEPEILVVDEVLAVGDAEFQNKCLGKMGDVAKEGRTVLFVSHNMSAIVSLCNRALLLENGRITVDANASQTVSSYLRTGMLDGEFCREVDRPGQKLTIKRVALLRNGQISTTFYTSDTLVVQIEFILRQRLAGAQIAFEFLTMLDECLFSSTNQDVIGDKPVFEAGEYVLCCPIELSIFRPGQYQIKVSSSIPGVEMLDIVEHPVLFDLLDDSSPVLKLGQDRRGLILPVLEWSLSTK
jgi:lipopolysaccharide transport system ATP-binding protein